jgi:2-methylcitrate dehydratase PrpD
MDCALRLRERHSIQPELIGEIRCRTAEGPVPRLWEPLEEKQRPRNGYAAKFSLPYLVAVILAKGRAGLGEFTDHAVQDQTVLSLAGKVRYTLDPSMDYPTHFGGHVRIRLTDGRVVEERQDRPRGGPDLPMSRDELEEKFRGNAGLLLKGDQIEEASTRFRGLVELRELTPLMTILRS